MKNDCGNGEWGDTIRPLLSNEACTPTFLVILEDPFPTHYVTFDNFFTKDCRISDSDVNLSKLLDIYNNINVLSTFDEQS